ncbi:hypothetical protein FBZ89_114129 [Nitrospirillum amazonense]|uniref:Uncharacterized protein n=1 Tax=Nitrospirillum amazonense TaxID=28077 RepID=A0A560F202_9PROT|nr:hypothetical protein [Nitrospirillum amazonense]TWB15535.1 hypothetical protein FBZ89_114129 [Nitrospirillum amazonense]
MSGSGFLKNILEQQAPAPAAEELPDDPAVYRAFKTVNHTQLGFAAILAGGKVKSFLYHSVANIELETRAGAEFLTFTDSGKAVTIQGSGLMAILRAMLRGSLMEICVLDGRPAKPGEPVIRQMAITDTTAGDRLSR